MQKKICDMWTLLKCAKYATIAYSHETDMPFSEGRITGQLQHRQLGPSIKVMPSLLQVFL